MFAYHNIAHMHEWENRLFGIFFLMCVHAFYPACVCIHTYAYNKIHNIAHRVYENTNVSYLT